MFIRATEVIRREGDSKVISRRVLIPHACIRLIAEISYGVAFEDGVRSSVMLTDGEILNLAEPITAL